MSRSKPRELLISITPVAGQRVIINCAELRYTLDQTWPDLLIIDFTKKKVKAKKEGKG